MEAVAAASIYLACREHRMPRSMDYISSYSRDSRRDVARCYRRAVRQLGLRVPLPSPADFVPRICEKLGLSYRTTRRAMEIAEAARRAGIVKKPETIAAAAAYLAAWGRGEPRSQRGAAEAAGVSEVALRKASRELSERLGLLVIRRR